jgi:protein-disulfide isomerase
MQFQVNSDTISGRRASGQAGAEVRGVNRLDKGYRKKAQRLKRQQEQQTKRRSMQIIVWSAAALVVALIAVLIIFKPKPGVIDVSYDNVPTLGKAGAPVKIVEFGDFKCSACAYFGEQIMPLLKKDYIDTGKATFSFQNWTIIFEDSFTAALAGQAIFHQNNNEFWKYYDAILHNQQAEKEIWATPDFLTDFAKKQGLKLDFDKLKKDIVDGTYASEVDRHNQFAVNHGFTGTPTILINGRKLDDKTALNYKSLKAAIDTALKQAEG